MEYTSQVAARLKNCGYSSVQMFYDILKYVLKFIGFEYKIVLIICWDIQRFRSLAPHKVDPHNDRSVCQWNGKGEFSENADSIVASILQQRIKRKQSSHGL
jgi:hypothetical protein